MNPLLSYAVKSLRKNRARTIVTVIGIMMSTALIVALTTLGTSLYRYVQEAYAYEDGDWHLGVINAKRQDVEQLSGQEDVQEPFRALSIGYANVETINKEKPYLYLKGVEQEYYRHMPVHVTEGRVPEGAGEVLLPESFCRTAADDWQIGSRMTLDVGLRLRDGQALWQYVPYGSYISDGGSWDGIMRDGDMEEPLWDQERQTYTVVGFYEAADDNESAPGYEALTWWDGDAPEDDYNRLSLWFQISDVGNNEFHKLYDEVRLVYGYDGMQIAVNRDYLSLYGVRVSQNGESTAAVAVVVILLFIILVGSVMLIYNAFAISVGERTRQFGLLSSIGATRKQIRRSVLYEAAIVSGAGVLSGVCVGIALVAAVLAAAGGMVANLMEFAIEPHLYVWFPAVLLAAALAALTVLVSAWIPAKRATRVTAIEAIRQNREIHDSGKRKKTPCVVEKLFGFEGTLSVLYSRRSRKQYRVTTVALFLSMVLFVSINAFSGYMTTVIQAEYKTANYDVLVSLQEQLTEGERQELLEELRGLDSVASVSQVRFWEFAMPLSENERHITKDFGEILSSAAGHGKMALTVSVVDDKSFSDFCEEHDLEKAEFLNTEALTVIVNNSFKSMDKATGNIKLVEGLLEEDGRFYADLSSNHFASYAEDHGTDITAFTAGYFADSLAPGCNANWNLSVMIPERLAKELGLPDITDSAPVYCLTASNHHKAAEDAEKLLTAKYPGGTVYDLAERQTGDRNLVFMLKLLANGFIIMVAVISVANVFNTISTSLKLRQKEFAMLKTVGMTQQGLRRMLNLECLMYGGKAVLFGLPVSVMIAAVMYYFFHKDVIFDFYLPVPSILIAVGSIFAVVFVTMLYTMQRMKKDNVIDVLKRESF